MWLLALAVAAAVHIDDGPRSLAARAIVAANELRLDDAELAATQAMTAAVVCDDDTGRSAAADALGVVARLRGNTDEALGYADEALMLADRTGDLALIARAHTDLGRVYDDLLARPDLARREYEQTVALAPRLAGQVIVVRALNNLGNLERAAFHSHEALVFFERARRIAGKRDQPGALAAEHNIAFLFASQHDPVAALRHLRRALSIERRTRSVYEGRTLLAMSEAYRELNRSDLARGYLSAARAVAVKVHDDLTLSSVLLRQADLRIERGEFRAAGQELAESHSLAARRGDIASLPQIEAYRAKLALAKHDLATAARIARMAAEQATRLSQTEIAAQAHALAGFALLQSGDRTAAKRSFRAAVELSERRRSLVAGDLFARVRFFQRETFPYEQLVLIAAQEHDADSALHYAELQKARTLAGVLHQSPAADDGGTDGPEGAILVEYALAGDRVIAIVRRAEGTSLVSLPATRAHVSRLAGELLESLSHRNEAFRGPARQLFDVLWKPLSIPPQSRVWIVPDEQLWRLPFQALMDDDGRFLARSVTISYAPSLAWLRAHKRDHPAHDRVLAVASLPRQETELDALRRIYGDRIDTVPQASETEVRRRMASYGTVHFAAHGVFVGNDPLESYLQLSPDALNDGRLTAREFMESHVPSSLVVLSSCSSAAGTVAPGEGLIGMSWALLVAGCPAVVASEWEVESGVTATMMTAFHSHLAAGASAADALRAAQLQAMEQPRSSHPFYWAAFVYIGAGDR